MLKNLKILVAAAILLGGVSTSHASIIINIAQSGGDVVATGSGKINLTNVTFGTYAPQFNPQTDPAGGIISLTDVSGLHDYDVYLPTFTAAPSNFGSSSFLYADSITGASFGVGGGLLFVPFGYSSNANLYGTTTWYGTTISDLNLTPGSYTWSWSTGGASDSITLNIGGGGAVATPEPGTIMLMGSGVLGMLGFRRRELMAYFKR